MGKLSRISLSDLASEHVLDLAIMARMIATEMETRIVTLAALKAKKTKSPSLRRRP